MALLDILTPRDEREPRSAAKLVERVRGLLSRPKPEPEPVMLPDQPITEGQMLKIAADAADAEHDAILAEDDWQSLDWQNRVQAAAKKATQTREDYEAHCRDQWKEARGDLPW